AIYNLAIQPDGKIVVVGSKSAGSSFDFLMARYTSAGVLDNPGFGAGGSVIRDWGSPNDWGTQIAFQSDGKILVAGSSTKVMLTRYTAAGVLDTTFAGTGELMSDLSNGNADSGAVHLDAAGRIYLGGSLSGDMAVERYDTSGNLDTTFAT